MAVHIVDGHPSMDGQVPPQPQQPPIPGNSPTSVAIGTDNSAPVTLDFSKAQPIQAAPPTPASAPTSAPVTLDFGKAQPLSSTQAAPQADSQPATIRATPGSMPNDPMAAKVANWTNNVRSDLMQGTSITPVGKFLSALGAHGFEVGVSPQVAEFMGSLPLGLLRATKGGAEIHEPGERVQGAKDAASGLLQASTIPSAFFAPEIGEAGADGLSQTAADAVTAGKATAKAAGNAAKYIKSKYSLKDVEDALNNATEEIRNDAAAKLGNAQDQFHGSIRDLVNSMAEDAGVQPEPAESMHDVAGNVADALKQKASGIYKQIDKAIGGTRFQSYDEQLNNVKKALRNSIGIDPDQDGKLIERINQIQDAKDAAWEKAKAGGVDPKLGKEADALWQRASALEDLGKKIQTSTSGLRPGLKGGGSATNAVEAAGEATSPAKLATGANRLYNIGRLQQALGSDNADEFLKAIETAKQRIQNIANEAAERSSAAKETAQDRKGTVKAVRKYTAGAAIGAGLGWKFHHALDALM